MSRKIKVGIVGLGRAGRFMHIPELEQNRELFEIAAVCDRDPERLENLPEFAANAAKYADFESILADPAVELVTIAIRNADHTPYTVRALDAGKKVVIEKPIAVSMEQIQELKRANERHPGQLFLRFNRRFEPAFLTLREVIGSGVLGTISQCKLYRQVGYVRRLDWQTLTKNDGGMLNNWGPHLIDQACRLLESRVVDIWCDMKHLVAAGDAEDQIKLLLRSENGRVADIEITTTVTIQNSLYEVWGNKGTAIVDPTGSKIRVRYVDPAQKLEKIEAVDGQFPLAYGNPYETLKFIEKEIPVRQDAGHTLQRGRLQKDNVVDPSKGYAHQDTIWCYLYAAIISGEPYPITFEDGMEVVRITEEARRVSGFVPERLCPAPHENRQGVRSK